MGEDYCYNLNEANYKNFSETNDDNQELTEKERASYDKRIFGTVVYFVECSSVVLDYSVAAGMSARVSVHVDKNSHNRDLHIPGIQFTDRLLFAAIGFEEVDEADQQLLAGRAALYDTGDRGSHCGEAGFEAYEIRQQ